MGAGSTGKSVGPSPTSPTLEPPNSSASRIGKACLACRRKKIKCDGQIPCHNCSSRDLACEYPESNDNASSSRRYAQSFEERCKQLDEYCRRLESLSAELTQSIASIHQLRGGLSSIDDFAAHAEELQQAARTLQSLPVQNDHTFGANNSAINVVAGTAHSHENNLGVFAEANESIAESNSDSDENSDDDDAGFSTSDQHPTESGGRFGSLVADSYGRLRYVGGAANNVLVEAVKGLSPGARASLYVPSPGSSAADAHAGAQNHAQPDLEMPMFVRGNTWPEMPYLPRPEEITRPPQSLHTPDKGFLSVFFAVCACASSLLPTDGKSETFSGLAYYQKSLILNYASTGEASLERVQCLALLAIIGDDDLENYLHVAKTAEESLSEPSSSPLTGFLAFTQLCHIGGKIQKLHSPSRMRRLRDPRKFEQFLRSVASLQKLLDKWLAELPDEIRFSANTTEQGPNLTMCVIMFIVHSGSLLNLYQLLSSTASQEALASQWHEAVPHCVSAAKSCINAAELVQQLVPPSHHLAFKSSKIDKLSAQRLRIPEYSRQEALPDVEKCIKFLKSLETTWSGARKGRAIIENLVSRAPEGADMGLTPQFMDDQNFLWEQMVGSDLFTFEGIL
ncbi:hypothetical protein S7711_11145 [Stachybotrys chartarum IBT 7711]|uniref:Zn(2)-C6 fungal-type domain-containing protein n=1 Tax=Stachybotrys chartarum (strain CBS 109288 / IBT 7711) TaxID=1280523 RepID=A0A084AFE9_STACB|nr:hypothetical protein S7711_11145 [Stachybotrys chartarum IBT 7711]